MTGIRVLRVLEYEYADAEQAEQDQERWTTSISTGRMRMRSSTLPFSAIHWEEASSADTGGKLPTDPRSNRDG